MTDSSRSVSGFLTWAGTFLVGFTALSTVFYLLYHVLGETFIGLQTPLSVPVLIGSPLAAAVGFVMLVTGVSMTPYRAPETPREEEAEERLAA